MRHVLVRMYAQGELGCEDLSWSRRISGQKPRCDPLHRRRHLALERGVRGNTSDIVPVRLVGAARSAEVVFLSGKSTETISVRPQSHRIHRAFPMRAPRRGQDPEMEMTKR
jgi:hypothetical protein